MSIFNKNKRTLKKELGDILTQMDAVRGVDNEQYKMLSEQYTALARVQNEHKVKPDTIFNGVLGIGGVALVMNFERLHVIATKAWPLVTKFL